jgi:hypothetical protein
LVKTSRDSGNARVHYSESPSLGMPARTTKLRLGKYREVLFERDVETERTASGWASWRLCDNNGKLS